MLTLVRLVGVALQTIAGLGSSYLALLTVATFLPRRQVLRSTPIKPRFAVIVPAHNEERAIPETLKSLERLDYPPELYSVFVVADNCLDATVGVARRYRCTVWERIAPGHKAKGHALGWAFEQVPEEYDAVVVVDADTKVDPALLCSFARAYEASTALQSLHLPPPDPGVGKVASYVAAAVQNCLKPQGRQNLGFSAGLGGTGMCIPRDLLEEVPWQRFGLAEDAEYHADLVLAGRKTWFVPEARVEPTGSPSLRGLQTQRLRWERGRVETLRRFAGALLARSLRERDVVSFDAFMSIAVPPLSLTVSASTGCVILGVMRRSTTSIVLGTLGLVAVACATLRSLWMVRAPAKIYAYSLFFPLFVVWRTYISVRSLLRGAGGDWVRTERPGELGSN
jgi:cellulose synthase/poly-beta-1,6-N-acetylglucosamine synthase-like glycosyltransferase